MPEFPEGNDVLISKGPCPVCGSKDNLATYADGHSHCYTPGCTGGHAPSGEPHERHQRPPEELLDPSRFPDAWEGFPKRGIEPKTAKLFGAFRAGYSGQKGIVYPYYSMSGDLANQKVRLPDKSFPVLRAEGQPGINECRLFGHHVDGDRFDRQLIITEGEDDTMAVAQAIGFKTAVRSVNTGAGNAVKCLKANYLWIDRFADIVLWFDDDEAGRKASEDCARLFSVGKVRIAKVAGFKDAREVLLAGKPGDIISAIFAANKWSPKGLVNAADVSGDVRAPRDRLQAYRYPDSMPLLQEMTGGLHLGECTYHVAGTGVGKSTQLREIAVDLMLKQDVKVGWLGFEDTRRDAQLLMMSIVANRRLQMVPLPDIEDKDFVALAESYDAMMLEFHRQTFGTRKAELFDAETAEWSLEAMLSYVHYMARALDCQVVMIDPLSFIVALMDGDADERRALDLVAAKLAKAAKELHINIQISHHLKRTQGIPHEEGAAASLNELRSSGGMANFASCVVGWERNNQADGEAWRVTRSRVLKPHRMIGRSGLADVLYYGENGRLVKSPIPFPPPGKPDGESEGDGSGARPQGGFSKDY